MALPELFANSPVPGIREPIATLTEALSEAGTTIKLSKAMPASLQTAGQARLLIDNEIILVEGTASTTVTALERGADSTTKKSHLNGSSVYHLLTKESLRRAGWPERGTELPASPVDGQEYDYVADATNGVIWRFRYRSASASTHKWEFVGGSRLLRGPLGSVTIPGPVAEEKPLVGGPSLTVPLSGEYVWNSGAQIILETEGVQEGQLMVRANGSPVTVHQIFTASVAFNRVKAMGAAGVASLGEGTVLTLAGKIQVAAARQMTFIEGTIEVTPIRVG